MKKQSNKYINSLQRPKRIQKILITFIGLDLVSNNSLLSTNYCDEIRIVPF